MSNEIPEIEELIKKISKLPGLGPKSAKRIILKLINNKDTIMKPLASSLSKAYKSIVRCVNCGNLKIADKICICEGESKFDKICVVENLADMWTIESANIFKGYYHILGGTLNSNDSYEQKNLLIESLIKRIKRNDSGGKLIQFLMRNFEGILTSEKKINLNQISDIIGVKKGKIDEQLKLLKNQKIIE